MIKQIKIIENLRRAEKFFFFFFFDFSFNFLALKCKKKKIITQDEKKEEIK